MDTLVGIYLFGAGIMFVVAFMLFMVYAIERADEEDNMTRETARAMRLMMTTCLIWPYWLIRAGAATIKTFARAWDEGR